MGEHASTILGWFFLVGGVGAFVFALRRGAGKPSRTMTFSDGSSWTVAAGGDIGAARDRGYAHGTAGSIAAMAGYGGGGGAGNSCGASGGTGSHSGSGC